MCNKRKGSRSFHATCVLISPSFSLLKFLWQPEHVSLEPNSRGGSAKGMSDNNVEVKKWSSTDEWMQLATAQMVMVSHKMATEWWLSLDSAQVASIAPTFYFGISEIQNFGAWSWNTHKNQDGATLGALMYNLHKVKVATRYSDGLVMVAILLRTHGAMVNLTTKIALCKKYNVHQVHYTCVRLLLGKTWQAIGNQIHVVFIHMCK